MTNLAMCRCFACRAYRAQAVSIAAVWDAHPEEAPMGAQRQKTGRLVPISRDRFVSRVCARCKRPGGTVSFRYAVGNAWKRDYFHPHCFKQFKAEQITT